jgi:protoheme IX farnesyltransferase
MLPVVIGDARCARMILAHTIALVALSVAPLAFGMGWIYAVAAVTGGAWFITASVRLVREPSRANARANFLASLAQLALLLTGALLERSLGG